MEVGLLQIPLRIFLEVISRCALLERNPCLSGIIWCQKTRSWRQVVLVSTTCRFEGAVLLVPKRFVKWQGEVNKRARSYYKHFVRNFIREEQLQTNGSLVQVVKRKGQEIRQVLLGDIEKKFPNTKEFLRQFSEKNPSEYEKFKKTVIKHNPIADGSIFDERDEEFTHKEFCAELGAALREIPAGKDSATDYHYLMVGVLQYIFYPLWTAPRLETPINDRRKRIDIRYVNSAETGFFRRVFADQAIHARWIMVECKNYSKVPKNPEVDQIAMRFSRERGHFGILCYRDPTAADNLTLRCRDVAKAGRGFVVGLNDNDILAMLDRIGQHRRSSIDDFMSAKFQELLS